MVTSVDGSRRASAAFAIASGVSPSPPADGTGNGVPPSPLPRRPRIFAWVAVLSLLDQIHTSVPFVITSVSPSVSSSATRAWFGPAYQTFSVWVPARREKRSGLPALAPGSAGSPRSAASHDGAGHAVDLGGLKVDEELGRAPRRERRVGCVGDRPDGYAATDDGKGGAGRNEPAADRVGIRRWTCGHLLRPSCRPPLSRG